MLQVHPISAFKDNYIWAIRCPATPRSVVVVDPGVAVPVERYLEEQGLSLAAILLTHKHSDHVGGVAALRDRHRRAVVVGPEHVAMPVPDRPVTAGQALVLDELGLRFDVIAIPGHTLEHIAFHGHDAIFCGDTLFSYGCGRLFEGEPAQMLASLDQIAALPEKTAVFCAHEYTEANLHFARSVLPADEELVRAADRISSLRKAGRPSLPARLADELRGNPFLRVSDPAVRASCERMAGRALPNRVAVFAALREWKDRA
jgi:hydroxyacylglutathione hydrolase